MSTQSKVAQTFLSVPKDCRILGTDRNVCATFFKPEVFR